MLVDQRFIRSEEVVWEQGLVALIQSLGHADALRFISRIVPRYGDYVVEQNRIFGESSVDELYEQAQAFWAVKQAEPSPAE